ncbi:ATP-binding protein [Inconstantimicrobium mannanitabidum]|uniref:Uncharacterized protein n=1 Tax=Inconstantimicrobium mannanitabidum TaxID=1604901 RepID=A0ACB5RCV2_9CLOT|nr:ATP-binding protein [Clostridium sp. TW13]GKX66883.1 hypothetical protein rsdtw13_21410 [Clostridium sp. TW13]
MDVFMPKVQAVAMFKEIALNIKNPNEVVREGISNCYDADAKNIWITIRRNLNGDVEIIIRDDGNGMNIDEIHSFFNLGDSKKMVENIGEKGLGTKTFFKSKRIIISTKCNNENGYIVEMENPWEHLLNGIVPTYTVENGDMQENGTEITISGYIIDNPEKYFNYYSLKDYILWFTAGGNFKNIFANNLMLQSRVKDMNKSPKIHIYDQILNRQCQMTGVHQFAAPSENPKEDPNNRKYKRSVNYCRAFGPFNVETTLNGEYVSLQLYGTVSGVNCRRKVCKLRQSETYKARFGIYLCKDFIPFERANFLLGDEQYYHYHILVNSQNFELTADRNSISNMESATVKWIFNQVEDIFKNNIKPIAEKEYFRMRKEEEESYDAECRVVAMNNYVKKIDLVDNLYINDIPIKKIPQCEYEVALLFAAMLANEKTKKLVEDIKNIISYSSRATTDVICTNYNEEIVLVEIEYKLSNIFKHKHPIGTYDYVVCWKIDLEQNVINQVNNVNTVLVSEGDEKYIVTQKNKKMKVMELSALLNKIYRS